MSRTQIVKKLPKVELHLHLEGAIPLPTLLSLCHRNGQTTNDLEMTLEKLEEKMKFTNFAHFIETFTWMVPLLKNEDDFEEIAYDVLKKLSSQNVFHVELFYSCSFYHHIGLNVALITDSIIRGANRAKEEFNISYLLIPDISRQIRTPLPQLKLMILSLLPYVESGEVVAIGLGGLEQGNEAEIFQEIFQFAKEKGFRCHAHAGEGDGPISVRNTIDLLKAERIGHGVRSIEDIQLIEILVDRNIHLEVCPTSNIRTGIYSSYDLHPIRKLFDLGVNISVNSDDPTFFNCTIESEYLLLFDIFHFNLDEVKKIILNAANNSFLKEEEKSSLLKRIHNSFTSIPELMY